MATEFSSASASAPGGRPPGRGDVRFRLIPVRGIGADDEAAWRALGARALEPNPLFEPDCIVPVARHDPRGARVHLAVAVRDGHFLAALPVWDVMPVRFPYPAVTSHVRRMQNLGTPLVDPAGGADALATVFGGLGRHRALGRPRVAYLDVSAADGPVASVLREAVSTLGYGLYVADSYERGLLCRRVDGDYDRAHSAKARYNLRRQRRQLSEHLGGADIQLVSKDPADPASVDEFVALEASGYKATAQVAMTTAAGEAEAFSEMCRALGRAGRLHVLALEAAGTTLAMQIWLRAHEGLFLTKISYDESFARFSPGVLLQTEAQRVFHDETDAEWIDTCTYKDNATLLRLYPDRRRVESLFVVLGSSPVDKAAVAGLLGLRELRGRLRQSRAVTAPPGAPDDA